MTAWFETMTLLNLLVSAVGAAVVYLLSSMPPAENPHLCYTHPDPSSAPWAGSAPTMWFSFDLNTLTPTFIHTHMSTYRDAPTPALTCTHVRPHARTHVYIPLDM